MTIKRLEIRKWGLDYKVTRSYRLTSPDEAESIAISLINDGLPSETYSYMEIANGKQSQWDFVSSSGGYFWHEVLTEKEIQIIKDKNLLPEIQKTLGKGEFYNLIYCDY